MTFTNTQIRAAILQTALTFERQPHMWNWSNIHIPDCGTPGCALGYIGHHLGMEKNNAVCRVSKAIGLPQGSAAKEVFYEQINDLCGDAWKNSAANAAKALRAYADKYFPADAADDAQSLDPAFLRFKAQFTESVEAT